MGCSLIVQYIHINFLGFCEVRKPRSNGTPVATSTPSVQTLLFNDPGLLFKMIDNRTGTGNIPDKPGAFYGNRNYESV